jgi:hypothetical protein
VNDLQAQQRVALHTRILMLIAQLADGSRNDAARDALLLDIHAYQRRWVAPYARFCSQRAQPCPALPTDAFRFARIASRHEDEDVRVFRSSGTTQSDRSLHAFADLSLYDAGAQAAARYMLFPDRERMDLLILAPPASELLDSSLSYMLSKFVTWFGARTDYVWPVAQPQLAQLQARLQHAIQTATPVALLGTSFAFVHAMDALGDTRFVLPHGSRIMQTGGFKGRSRELSPLQMSEALCAQFGVAEPFVVAEYGMTELSSQLYENTLRNALMMHAQEARALWSPGWTRVTVVHPETLREQPDGEVGLVRIDDACNLDSVSAIQTADLGVMQHGKLSLLGRAQGAVARGCSITADQLLSERKP